MTQDADLQRERDDLRRENAALREEVRRLSRIAGQNEQAMVMQQKYRFEAEALVARMRDEWEKRKIILWNATMYSKGIGAEAWKSVDTVFSGAGRGALAERRARCQRLRQIVHSLGQNCTLANWAAKVKAADDEIDALAAVESARAR